MAEDTRRETTTERENILRDTRIQIQIGLPVPCHRHSPVVASPSPPWQPSALLCSEKRGKESYDLQGSGFLCNSRPRLFFNPPPPPSLPSSVSSSSSISPSCAFVFLLRPQRLQLASGHKSQNFNAGVSTGHLPPSKDGPALIYPSRQSAPFWSFFASARFGACNKRATACRGSTLHKRRLSILLVCFSSRPVRARSY